MRVMVICSYVIAIFFTITTLLMIIIEPEKLSIYHKCAVLFTTFWGGVGVFIFGQWCIRDEIEGKLRRIDKDLNSKYNQLTNVIELARLLVNKNTNEIIFDYENSIRKKENIIPSKNESNTSAATTE